MGCDGRNDVRIHVEHAALGAFLLLQILQLRPQLFRSLGGGREELLVAVVRTVIQTHELGDVDLLLPASALEPIPFSVVHFTFTLSAKFHIAWIWVS